MAGRGPLQGDVREQKRLLQIPEQMRASERKADKKSREYRAFPKIPLHVPVAWLPMAQREDKARPRARHERRIRPEVLRLRRDKERL